MVLVQKWPFFQTFFFLGNIGQENVFYDILQRKNSFLGFKKKKIKKSKNWHFSKGVNLSFWSQRWAFFKTLFFRQYRQGKCLSRYSRKKKQAFLGYKNKKFKTSKKGVNPWFWSKNDHFFKLFFYSI